MKKCKFLSALCAMALTASLTLTGCGSSDAGRYDLYSMTQDGETMTVKDIEEMYKEMDMELPEMYLELKDNGTGQLVMGDEDTEKVEWEDGVITADDEEIKYTIKDDKLTMESDGVELVFEKAE
ncbi:MAG: hypothetical protein MR503_09265 [Oscillospiraceae bacterium]|nr:hypothetical protein [Oscillospiraceae bacterium]